MSSVYEKLLAFLITGLLTLTASRQLVAQSWLDDFSDGNATDGMPVTWVVDSLAQGSYDVVSGDYVATGSNSSIGSEVMSASVPSAVFGDVSIQTQASVTGVGALAVGRGGTPPRSGYGGYLNSSGELGIYRTDGDIFDPATPLVVLNSTNVGFNSSAEVKLQLDIRGSNLSVMAWLADQPKPALPQVTATDTRYTRGSAGIAFQENSSDPDAFASFRYVQATAIPEPSAQCAVLAGMLCIAIQRNRWRKIRNFE